MGDLENLIDPLYEGMNGINLFIYARTYDYAADVTRYPSYDNLLYVSSDIEITSDIFD